MFRRCLAAGMLAAAAAATWFADLALGGAGPLLLLGAVLFAMVVAGPAAGTVALLAAAAINVLAPNTATLQFALRPEQIPTSVGLLAVGGGCIFAVERLRAAIARSQSAVELVRVERAAVQLELAEALEAQRKSQTERKRVLGALENLAEAVVVADVTGRVIMLNAVARGVTGWTQRDAHGRWLGEVLPLVDSRRARHLDDPVMATIRADSAIGFAGDVARVARSAEHVPIELSTAPVRGDDGAVVGVVLSFRDRQQGRHDEMMQRRLAELVESSQDAIYAVAQDGTIESWNEGAERLFGYTADEVIGRSVTLLRPLDRSTEIPELWEQLRQGERLPPYETVRVRKGGRPVEVQLRASPLTDEAGNLMAASIIARDITARRRGDRRRAARLAVTEILSQADSLTGAAPALLHAICDNIGWEVGALWQVDREAQALQCTAFWRQPSARVDEFEAATRRGTCGFGEGFPGRVWKTCEPIWIKDVTKDSHFPRMVEAAGGGLFGGVASPIFVGEDVLGVVEFFFSERIDPEPDLVEMMRTLGNLIGQFARRTELVAQLRHSEQQLSDLFENAAIGLHWVGEDGTILRVNRAECELLGYAKEEMIGRHAAEFHADPHVIRDILERLKGNETIRDCEARLVAKDGSIRHVLLDSNAYWEDGEFVHSRCFTRDITLRKRAEEELLRSESRTKAILNSAMDAIITMDHHGRIVDFNPGAERIFGYTQEQVAGRPLAEMLIPPALREEHSRGVENFLRTGDGPMLNRLVELPAMRANGTEFPAEVSITVAQAVGDAAGNQEAFFTACLRDITARKEIELTLRRREEELRLITDGVPALISYVDTEGRYRFANQQYEIWFGVPRQSLYGRHLREVLGEAAYEKLHEYVESALAGVETVYETWVDYQLAGRKFIQGRYMPHLSATGAVDGFFVLVTDDTQRKLAEESLYESERRFRAMAEAAPVLLWMSEPDRKCSYFNQRWLEFTGRTLEEELGDGWADSVHPDDREHCLSTYHSAFDERRPFEMEYRLRTADGSHRWVWNVAVPRFTAGGDFAGYIGSCVDVTDRKQAAADLVAAKEAAEEANRVRTQFLANVSHELRTPLNAILGMTELALDHQLPPTVRDHLGTVQSSSEELLRLVNEILDFSRLESGSVRLEATAFCITDVLETVVKAFRSRAAEKGLELVSELTDPKADCVVGDPLRLRQVLINLVGNAVKFTERGEVILRAAVRSKSSTSATIDFSVTDTGIGIAADKLGDIFEPFAQADASTTRLYGGTGLGLAIVKGLVTMMGGTIAVQSTVGRGSCFSFTVSFATDGERASYAAPDADALRGVPVLLIGASDAAREALCRDLESWGIAVEAYREPRAAVAAAKGRPPEAPFRAALVDVASGGDAFQAGVSQINEYCSENGFSLPIAVMVFAHDRAALVDRAGPCPAAAIIEKPVTRSDLFDGLSRVLGVARPPCFSSKAETPDREKPAPAPPEAALRVLLVEDTPANRQLVRKMLEDRGHRVTVAIDGESAVSVAAAKPFDVVLMDVQMPVMDGYDATRAIRGDAHSMNQTTPIVAMTAHAMPEDRIRCFDAGMNQYIAKPVDRRQLIETIEAAAAARTASFDAASDQSPPGKDGDAGSFGVPELPELKAAIMRLGDDESLYREMADCLFEDAPSLLGRMRDAVAAGNAAELGRAAHTLKSLAATVGARPLADAAAEIERLASLAAVADAAGRIDTLENLLDGTVAAINSRLPR